MEDFLLYIGKAALALGAFYMAYLALFQHQKHFLFNRIYLPVSFVASFLIPLITFTKVRYIQKIPVAAANSFAYLPETTTVTEAQFSFEWYHYLLAIYTLGILVFFGHLLIGHLRAMTIIRFSRLKELFGAQINLTLKDVHPFSFFSRIVLSEKTLKNPNLKMIVDHEMVHVREHHTLDILIAELLFLLQWFNPFAWLIRDAMRNNLEYLTDHQVTRKHNAEAYQLAMVGLAHKEGVAPFLTALNGSQLKNRIIMMKKKTKNRYSLLKQLVVLPLLAMLVMSLSNKEVRTEVVQPTHQIKVVVDGVELPAHHPDLMAIDFSNGFDGGEVINALGLEDKVVANALSFDKNPNEGGIYYIQTSDYIPGTNTGFEHDVNGKLTSELTVSGKITNDKGEPMPNVAVLIKGTTTGTITDSSGKYVIKADESSKLLFKKPGYTEQELPVKGKSEMNVKLIADGGKKTDEVKVIRYGNMNQPDLPKIDINKLQIRNLEAETGEAPLYIVDGKEAQNLDRLEPDAIESISILKDESATSLYGDKAKNGVLIITTKDAAVAKVNDALGIVDGKLYNGDVSDIDPEAIKSVDVLNEKKGKNGIVGIVTKANQKSPAIDFNDLLKTTSEKTPLYIVDGKEGNNIDFLSLDKEEINSISILKDGSATALYGEKAKNGVVIITTKKDK